MPCLRRYPAKCSASVMQVNRGPDAEPGPVSVTWNLNSLLPFLISSPFHPSLQSAVFVFNFKTPNKYNCTGTLLRMRNMDKGLLYKKPFGLKPILFCFPFHNPLIRLANSRESGVCLAYQRRHLPEYLNPLAFRHSVTSCGTAPLNRISTPFFASFNSVL
jgi:hypothetical protein